MFTNKYNHCNAIQYNPSWSISFVRSFVGGSLAEPERSMRYGALYSGSLLFVRESDTFSIYDVLDVCVKNTHVFIVSYYISMNATTR
jgi:hypothetical protein